MEVSGKNMISLMVDHNVWIVPRSLIVEDLDFKKKTVGAL